LRFSDIPKLQILGGVLTADNRHYSTRDGRYSTVKCQHRFDSIHIVEQPSLHRRDLQPVLSDVRVKTYDEGVKLIHSGAFGNGAAIFTNDDGVGRRFKNGIEVGINTPIPVPVAYYSFGGLKDSIFGDANAYGMQGFHFFTREKAITSRWADPSHGGISLGFPMPDLCATATRFQE